MTARLNLAAPSDRGLDDDIGARSTEAGGLQHLIEATPCELPTTISGKTDGGYGFFDAFEAAPPSTFDWPSSDSGKRRQALQTARLDSTGRAVTGTVFADVSGPPA